MARIVFDQGFGLLLLNNILGETIMVLVSKEEKRIIFSYLLKEGVVVVKKDSYLKTHHNIAGVSNLKVQMLVKSLKSRGYLHDIFSW